MSLSLIISTRHLKFIIEQIETFSSMETGGVLIGFRNKREIHVSHIIGPGPRALHTRQSFTPDNNFHTKRIAHRFRKTKGKLTYIGDWHTHPGGKSFVSERDKIALANISSYEPARLPDPVMLIVGTDPFELKCWRYTNSRLKSVLLRELTVELRI